MRNQNREWRNVKLYDQERNLMTSFIARLNCFLHGIEAFRIERGDTLAEPKPVEGGRLQRFDGVLANPPYSIKQSPHHWSEQPHRFAAREPRASAVRSRGRAYPSMEVLWLPRGRWARSRG